MDRRGHLRQVSHRLNYYTVKVITTDRVAKRLQKKTTLCFKNPHP
jgi:hypothetical protein